MHYIFRRELLRKNLGFRQESERLEFQMSENLTADPVELILQDKGRWNWNLKKHCLRGQEKKRQSFRYVVWLRYCVYFEIQKAIWQYWVRYKKPRHGIFLKLVVDIEHPV